LGGLGLGVVGGSLKVLALEELVRRLQEASRDLKRALGDASGVTRLEGV